MATKLNKWKDEIRKAKAYQDKGGRLSRWANYRAWYRNEYSESLVSVNKIFGVGRAMIPQLYFKAPTVLCRARKPNMGDQAKVVESIDQWLIPHMGLKLQIKYAILDAYITNIGCLKVGYGTIGTELPTPDDENVQAVAEMIGADPDELGEEMKETQRWSYHDYVRPDTPWALRVRPQDILVPWGFVDEHEAPWVAFRIIRPLADVKKDPIYKATRKLKANVRIDSTDKNVASPNMFKNAPNNPEFVELFEIWDKRDGTIKVLDEDSDEWLRNEEHNLDIRGIPGVILRFNPDGEDFWGISDVEQIRKQQNELNENRTHEIESKRLANVKGIIDRNVVPETEVQKLQAGRPGVFVLSDGPPGAAFTEFQGSRIPSDLFRVDEVIDKDIRETIGFGRNQQGEYSGRGTTATEANYVQQGNELRADERRDQVADMIVELFQDKVNPLIFQQWTDQRVIEVTAMGGWVKYTGPQIKGDYDLSCVADSAMPMTKAQEQQMSIQAFQLFRGDIRVRQRELYLRVCQSFKDLFPDAEQILLSDEEVSQIQQQQAQAQAQQQQKQAEQQHQQEMQKTQQKHQMDMQREQAQGQREAVNRAGSA